MLGNLHHRTQVRHHHFPKQGGTAGHAIPDQNVGGFDVRMEEVQAVQMRQRAAHGFQDAADYGRLVALRPAAQVVLQVAVHEREHEARLVHALRVALEAVQEADDGGVRAPLQPHRLEDRCGLGPRTHEHLEGELAAERDRFSADDLPESAAPDARALLVGHRGAVLPRA